MTRPKKTAAQMDSMRTQILDAAYAILLDKGLTGLTSRAIAERLGTAHMTLFTYFENQEAILQALANREMAKVQLLQETFAVRAASEDILTVMRDALLFYPQFEKKNPNLYHVVWVMIFSGQHEAEYPTDRVQTNIQYLSRLIQIGIERGQFVPRDPALAASTVLSMINTPLIFWHSGRIATAEQRDRLIQEMLHAALGYLTRPPVSA